MVKPARELDTVVEEAGIPYEETALARQAAPARARLVRILLVGALLLAVLAVARANAAWVAGTIVVGAIALGVRAARLGGVIAAALVAALAVLVPLRLLFLHPGGWDLAAIVVSVALGAACVPDLVTLVRDAELQHTYGLWARRP